MFHVERLMSDQKLSRESAVAKALQLADLLDFFKHIGFVFRSENC